MLWNCETHNKVVRLGMPICIKYTGFLIFCVVTEPQNSSKSAKFTKTWKIPPNSVEILSNTCLYNIFETHFSYWGYLIAINLQIMYIRTSSLHLCKMCKQSPETTRHKLGTSHDVKSFAIGSFLERIVVERANVMTSVRKTLKMLVWWAQNRSISIEICLENNHKTGRFLPAFWWSWPRKFPWNSHEIGWIFPKFVPKNPAKFGFFFHDLSEALNI